MAQVSASDYFRRNGKDIVSWLFWVAAGGAVFMVASLNMQPWLAIGQDIANHIVSVPALPWLARVALGISGAKILGFIGLGLGIACIKSGRTLIGAGCIIVGLWLIGATTTVVNHFGSFAGFCLWAWVQWVQVMPILAGVLGLSGVSWIKKLRRAQIIAYLTEFIACFWFFPPYADGNMGRLLADASIMAFDPSLFDWGNFFRSTGTMVGVELTIVFLIQMALALDSRNGKTGGASSKKASSSYGSGASTDTFY